MTNIELRRILEEYPDDLPVILLSGRNELANGRETTRLQVIDCVVRYGVWNECLFDDDCDKRKCINLL